MLDIKEVFKNTDEMSRNLKARKLDVDLNNVKRLHEAVLDKKKKIEAAQQKSNKLSKQNSNPLSVDERDAIILKGQKLKKNIAELKISYTKAKEQLDQVVMALPNWISDDVPIGKDDSDNLEIKQYLEPAKFDFTARDHLTLGKELDLLDFESAARVTGSKFYFLKNELVILQHAIKSFVFQKALEENFTCLSTPDLVRSSILQGLGYAPRGEESNSYSIADQDLCLIPTSEITVGGIHCDEIISQDKLPLLYVAESHCFRKESGAAGQEGKGLYRVHQFEKIELFIFCEPSQSAELHDKILALQENIYQDLKIPYRVVLNCSGDLGNPAYKKYDIEAWMPGKGESGEFGEITSTSNCTDYQSRRLNIRYKNKQTRKNEFVHTLNGTAVALSRVVIAIMENYQTKEGGIKIPEALQPFLNFDYIPPKS